VFYTVGGSAQVGTDFTLNPMGQVVIPAGQTSATITFDAMTDTATTERGEKAKLTLNPNATYRLPRRNGKNATVKITNVH
jgi:hypothetical protein